jgi:hypothetical protein
MTGVALRFALMALGVLGVVGCVSITVREHEDDEPAGTEQQALYGGQPPPVAANISK